MTDLNVDMDDIETKRLMLIDDSCFAFEKEELRALFAECLIEASGEFDLVFVTQNPSPSFTSTITDLPFPNGCAIDTPTIRHWDDILDQGGHIDVLMTRQDEQKDLLDSCDFLLDPAISYTCGAFANWCEWYEDNLEHLKSDSVTAMLDQRVATLRIQRDITLREKYMDHKRIWQDVLSRPEMCALLDMFHAQSAEQPSSYRSRERAKDFLHIYFDRAATGGANTTKDLISIRDDFRTSFIADDIPAPQRRTLLNGALKAINQALRSAPQRRPASP